MKRIKSNLLKILTIIIIAVGIGVFVKFFTDNTNLDKDEIFVQIPTGSKYEDVKNILAPFIKNSNSFDLMAKVRKYSDNIKPGKFLIKKGMNSFELVSTMRRNVPVNLAFNNQERLENLCERLSAQIEPDTTKLLSAFRDFKFLNLNGFTREDVLTMFLPNTYQVYWNISAEKFRDKMLDEYKRFWTKERLGKAEELRLSPQQVTILASIVHKETVKKDERKIVAGVYLNRLTEQMPLQADPTVIYAVKMMDNNFDQVIKRVYEKQLLIDSPYNTYVNLGLPPGPIAMPDVDAIDAVLNAEKHNYIYFCANPEKFGYHSYAATYAEHLINAKKYADWLNTQASH